MKRTATVKRETKETTVKITLDLDGDGICNVKTRCGFLDHMLDLLACFAGFDLCVAGKGDLHVDRHHLVEDAGILLGKALKTALGGRKGIARFGFASLPMDETLMNVTLDISGRPYLAFNVPVMKGQDGRFETEDAKEFLRGFVNHAGVTLHVNFLYGDNLHHVNEAIFKGLGLALKQAVAVGGSRLPSTKGSLD